VKALEDAPEDNIYKDLLDEEERERKEGEDGAEN